MDIPDILIAMKTTNQSIAFSVERPFTRTSADEKTTDCAMRTNSRARRRAKVIRALAKRASQSNARGRENERE